MGSQPSPTPSDYVRTSLHGGVDLGSDEVETKDEATVARWVRQINK